MQLAPASTTYPHDALPVSGVALKEKALRWAQQFSQVAFYDGNASPYPHSAFQTMLGVSDTVNQIHTLAGLQAQLARPTYFPLLGYLTYDLKNQIEKLSSSLPDELGWPELHFFEPETLVQWQPEGLRITSALLPPDEVLRQILKTPASRPQPAQVAWQQRTSKKEYLADVQRIRQHVEDGDVYELTYCQEFFAQLPELDAVSVFLKLMALSPMPFSGFFKLNHLLLLCASPERFLKKEDRQLISQPIKGTIRRGQTPAEDQNLKHQLLTSKKERAENMMIVDLVRNDLSRCCQIGSVKVEELFGIYSFPFVHQMISTISGQMQPGANLETALRALFPMGSMTGAPKIRAMQLIEQYEKRSRGLFSGSLGYIFPGGSADFNVVIRSLQYNSQNRYLSYQVGSAITYASDPDQEYEECLLKASAIKQALEG